jgi:hypothetical protein
VGSGLHVADVHVGKDEARPRIEVRFGSWDSLKKRYRAPKGRKGEKRIAPSTSMASL